MSANRLTGTTMLLLAYGCLVLGIPGLCVSAGLALDGTPWPGHLLYIIPTALLSVFVFIVLACAPRRPFMHLVFGVVLVPIMWLVTAVIISAVLFSPAALDGIR